MTGSLSLSSLEKGAGAPSRPRPRVGGPVRNWLPPRPPPHRQVFDIAIGKYVIESSRGVAEHWAVRVSSHGVAYWFEVGGDNSAPLDPSRYLSSLPVAAQQIYVHQMDAKYDTIVERFDPSKPETGWASSLTLERVRLWCMEWLRRYPSYFLLADNCQQFVQDFIHCLVSEDIDLDMQGPVQLVQRVSEKAATRGIIPAVALAVWLPVTIPPLIAGAIWTQVGSTAVKKTLSWWHAAKTSRFPIFDSSLNPGDWEEWEQRMIALEAEEALAAAAAIQAPEQ